MGYDLGLSYINGHANRFLIEFHTEEREQGTWVCLLEHNWHAIVKPVKAKVVL